MNPTDLLAILPLIILIAWASALVLVDIFALSGRKHITAALAALGLVVTLVVTLATHSGPPQLALNGMISVDGFAVFLTVLFLASGLLAIALSYGYLKRMGINQGEYYTLMLYAIGGMMLMAYAADLIVVFLALELLSIPLYILAGFGRPRLESEESAMKYFLLGAFASGFFVYGVAMVFGATGTTNMQAIVSAINAGTANINLMLVGGGLILVGLGFKVGAVPFHMWTPDVYQGAPSAVTAFMAVGAKAGGFAALLRIFIVIFAEHQELAGGLTDVLWLVSAATMIVGNVLAVSQRNIKRMLAYSSIAHAGFILMALVPFGQGGVVARDSVASALFYLLAFALTSFGVWAVVMALEKMEDDENGLHKGLNLDDYAGLGRKHPGFAAAMVVFMLSFTGLPPTLGFVGKLYLFRTAIDGGFVGLAVIGVLTSLISAYYYLRVIVYMYMHEGTPELHTERMISLTVGATAVGTVALSLFATPIFQWAVDSILTIF